MVNEVNEAFSRQSENFDDYEERNKILKWMRSITQRHLFRHLKKGDVILELNAGTGIDAVYLGNMGFRIHCIDIAEGMIKKLGDKIDRLRLNKLVSYQVLSFTDLDRLENRSFDYIFSNFGGVNCADDLSLIFSQFREILKPGGKVTMVIIPPFCPWETALILKGQIKTAFRRMKKRGIWANVEGIRFPVFYYSVSETIKALGRDYQIIELQGLASISPPPYMENFPKRYPRIYKRLTYWDEKLSHFFPFNRYADHFILTAEFKPK